LPAISDASATPQLRAPCLAGAQEREVGDELPPHRDHHVEEPEVEVLEAVPRPAVLGGVETAERQRIDVGVVVGHVRVGVVGEMLGRPDVGGATDQVERERHHPVDRAPACERVMVRVVHDHEADT
jgi:hypothetical protein